MEMEMFCEILKRVAAVGFLVAFPICFIGGAHVWTHLKKNPTPLMIAGIACLILALSALAALSVVKNKQLPQCPNCEKAVASAFCSDCGWEAGQASHCPECGAEWGSAFCGNCGTKMDLEG